MLEHPLFVTGAIVLVIFAVLAVLPFHWER
jgi:hypothetical protein